MRVQRTAYGDAFEFGDNRFIDALEETPVEIRKCHGVGHASSHGPVRALYRAPRGRPGGFD